MKTAYLQILFFIFVSNFYGQTDSEIVSIEGFCVSGWETSSFYEKKGDEIIAPIWLEFDSALKLSDSLSQIFEKNVDGVFLKIIGKKEVNGNFGHLGASRSQITVTQILFIDPKKTLKNNFVKKKVDK